MVGWSEELVSSEFFSFKGFFVSRNVLSCARNYVSSLDFLPLAKLLGLIFGFTLGSWGPFYLERHTGRADPMGERQGGLCGVSSLSVWWVQLTEFVRE